MSRHFVGILVYGISLVVFTTTVGIENFEAITILWIAVLSAFAGESIHRVIGGKH